MSYTAIRRVAGAFGLLAAAALTAPAAAHVGHDSVVRVLVSPKAVRVTVSVPAALLSPLFDSDGDGTLTKAEFAARRGEMQQWLDARVVLRGADGTPVSARLSDLPVTGYAEMAETAPVERARLVRIYPRPAAAATLEVNLFAPGHPARPYVMAAETAPVMGRLTPDSRLIAIPAPLPPPE